jgi:hypothetical protein
MSTRSFLLLAALVGCTGEVTPPDSKDTDTGDSAAPTDADGDGWDSSVDCDDQDPDVHPNGTEVCDTHDKDEDCDGTADDLDGDASGQVVVYADADGDGWGDDGSTAQKCDPAEGEALQGGDCDDGNPEISPGAAEVCDDADVDEDCDGDADDDDDDVTGTVSAWLDIDGDGYGDPAREVEVCDPGAGTALNDLDCDDANFRINPDGQEVCDSADADEDCDGLTDDADDSATGKVATWTDADADGYGVGEPTDRCDTTGVATADGDCDDGNAAISPGQAEICDAGDVDEDCDGLADDADPDTSDLVGTYTDADGDGYGDDATPVWTCDPADDAIRTGGDCDDADASKIGRAHV